MRFKVNLLKSMGYILISLAISVGLITRIFAVFQYVTFDISPDPDQIRDAFTVMRMWQGDFPTLGPMSSIGKYHILPLYYYLFFPFTFLGADPVFQALPNALFSFLSIPLLMYLVYQLLEKVNHSRRIFLSGLAGFWYSLLFGEIFISNFQWNPSSIPFFLMIFALLYKLQIQGDLSFLIQAILWSCYGIVLAVLISLHSSTLFIMPVVFTISSLLFMYQAFRRKQKSLLFLPGLASLSAIIILFPYWIGEINRHFSNTKLILRTIVSSSHQSNSFGFLPELWNRIYRLLFTYFELGEQVYFWGASWGHLLISIVFISIVTYVGITYFRGNKYIFFILASTWIIYLYAASNLDKPTTIFYYKLVIIFAPIILTVISLGYLNYSLLINRLIAIILGAIIIFSLASNALQDYKFLISKYGSDRLMNTADLTQIITKIPSNSTICNPKIRRLRKFNNEYNYIDNYITHKGIQTVDDCQKGNYIIYPKRIILIKSNFLPDKTYQTAYFVKEPASNKTTLWPTFKVINNEPIERQSKLLLETETAYVYLLD